MPTTGLPHEIPYLIAVDPPSLHGITTAMAAQIAARLGSVGKSIVAGSESRTNTAYGLLTTADRVQNVVLPSGGLLIIHVSAFIASSVSGAGRAALFVGSSQLKTRRELVGPGGSYAPQTQAAPTAGDADKFAYLTAGPGGLVTLRALSDGDFTAGYGPGAAGEPVTAGFWKTTSSGAMTAEIGGSVISDNTLDSKGAFGGGCPVVVDAGTYDVSLQFKASSGSVTAKNRMLWVEALPF